LNRGGGPQTDQNKANNYPVTPENRVSVGHSKELQTIGEIF
jgi:hypothetical protein